MNDPHVEWIKYRIETGKSLSYGACAPVEGELPGFRYRLVKEDDRNVLTLTMKDHYATEDDALAAVAGFIRDWQVYAELRGNQNCFQPHLVDVHLVDRAPDPNVVHLYAVERLVLTDSAEVHMTMGAFPPCPVRFRVTPDVDVMWTRFARSQRGSEPILSVAYFCFSFVCLVAGGSRAQAAAKYGIDEDVLKTMSKLAATRGDWSEARKAERDSTNTRLMEKELSWLRIALQQLIEQVAAYEADPSAPLVPLTMADLPSL